MLLARLARRLVLLAALNALAAALAASSPAAPPAPAKPALPLVDSSAVRDPVQAHFETEWRALEAAGRTNRLAVMATELADCRRRLPPPGAYEYDLLARRAAEVERGLAELAAGRGGDALGGRSAYLLDALEGEIGCKEAEGWEHKTGPVGVFHLPPGCEGWQSNCPIVIEPLDPGTPGRPEGRTGSAERGP